MSNEAAVDCQTFYKTWPRGQRLYLPLEARKWKKKQQRNGWNQAVLGLGSEACRMQGDRYWVGGMILFRSLDKGAPSQPTFVCFVIRWSMNFHIVGLFVESILNIILYYPFIPGVYWSPSFFILYLVFLTKPIHWLKWFSKQISNIHLAETLKSECPPWCV